MKTNSNFPYGNANRFSLRSSTSVDNSIKRPQPSAGMEHNRCGVIDAKLILFDEAQIYIEGKLRNFIHEFCGLVQLHNFF